MNFQFKPIINKKLWLLPMLFTIISCNTKHRIWVGKNNEQKVFNLKYGADKNQKMDIYLPENYDKDGATVMIVHGGAWKIGKKEHMVQIQNFLHRNHIPTANIDYRLVSKKTGILYTDQLDDIGFALVKLKEILAKTQLNPENIILLGESSGAHISMLYAYEYPLEIKKVISLSGPTDFYSPTFLGSRYSELASPTFSDIVGEKFDRTHLSEKFREASPIFKAENVPTLLFQGRKDFLVNYRQGKALDSVLTMKKIPHTFVDLGNVGHVSRIFRPKVKRTIIFPEILKFIKEK